MPFAWSASASGGETRTCQSTLSERAHCAERTPFSSSPPVRGRGQGHAGLPAKCAQCPDTLHSRADTLVRDGKRKRFLLAAYRAKLASIPCRHFDYGRGVCPFGDACFYAHLNADGSVNRTQRTRIDKDGNVGVMATPKLSDFLAPAFRAVDEMDTAARARRGRERTGTAR